MTPKTGRQRFTDILRALFRLLVIAFGVFILLAGVALSVLGVVLVRIGLKLNDYWRSA